MVRHDRLSWGIVAACGRTRPRYTYQCMSFLLVVLPRYTHLLLFSWGVRVLCGRPSRVRDVRASDECIWEHIGRNDVSYSARLRGLRIRIVLEAYCVRVGSTTRRVPHVWRFSRRGCSHRTTYPGLEHRETWGTRRRISTPRSQSVPSTCTSTRHLCNGDLTPAISIFLVLARVSAGWRLVNKL